MDFKKLLESQPDGWFETLERAVVKERARREWWRRHHSEEMTYERYVYMIELEAQVSIHYMSPDIARDLLNKYDKDNPDAKF